MSHIKSKFNIKWLRSNTVKIIEIEKDKLFKIHDDTNNELMLEIHPEKNVAIL